MDRDTAPRLVMMKGLPASGKSTLAKQFVQASKGTVKRVCKDDLRAMIDVGEHSHANEELILKARDHLVMLYLLQGKDVVVDDTNLAPKHEARLKQLAYDAKAEFEVLDLTNVPLEVCFERDAKRPNYVGSRVILDMWKRYLAPEPPTPLFDTKLSRAVVVDIDGTLAFMKHRGPYDQARCETDEPNVPLIYLLGCMRNWDEWGLTVDPNIILVSGRWEDFRPQTEAWLLKHEVPYDLLLMRASGDNRKDTVVKREIYEQHVKGKFNVVGWFDDRPSVIRMVRYDIGLPVYDVAQSWEF